MKYCQRCGTQLSDDAIFCSNCGIPTHQFHQQTWHHPQNDLIIKLSSRLKISGIIWIIIACIQILIGIFGAWFVLIVGVVNIVSAIKNLQYSERILKNPIGIVKTFEPLTNAIITLVYNVIIGGLIGVLGSIYYMIFVRGFVMEHQKQFLLLEYETEDR